MSTTYTDTQRSEALDLHAEHGTAETSRRTGISSTTITRWAREAGRTVQTDVEKTATARAAGAERVLQAWGDFRAGEAMQAGAVAGKARNRLAEALDDPARPIGRAKELAVVYGIMIDKAELLSGNATERIEHWAESEVDRELKRLVSEMENRARAD